MKRANLLGRTLVEKGLLDEAQLKRGLDAQLVYGGHLGTCLIELGFITEEQLGRQLAELFDVPYAVSDRFERIARFVTETIPAALAERHQAVPFELDDNVLSVAMIDPRELRVLDELAFASGRNIQPWVCPEVRLFQALERYYDVPRRPRYISLCRQLDGKTFDAPFELIRAPSATRYDEPAEKGVARTAAAGAAVAEQARPATASPAAVLDPMPSTLDEVSQRLCRAESRRELADAVLDSVGALLPRAMLFVVKSGQAEVWSWRGLELARDKAAAVRFPITEEPLFTLLLGNLQYFGQVPCQTRYRDFYDRLGIGFPRQILLLPVYHDDRLVALFHGEPADENLEREEIARLTRLMKKLGVGLNIIFQKLKLRAI